MHKFGVVVMVVAACGGDGGGAKPDAAVQMDAPGRCVAPAAPLPPGMAKLFLNVGGVTLTKGPTDATTNTTDLIMASTVTVPPMFDGQADRQLYIDQIVGFVQSRLAPFSIDVVTTRPASGDYYMIVMGGKAVDVIGMANVASYAPAPCNSLNGRLVSLVFDNEIDAAPRKGYATSVLSDFGSLVGMGVTTTSMDCMCRATNNCLPPDVLCTYGDAAAVNPMYSCGRTVQDEPALLQAALGCR